MDRCDWAKQIEQSQVGVGVCMLMVFFDQDSYLHQYNLNVSNGKL